MSNPWFDVGFAMVTLGRSTSYLLALRAVAAGSGFRIT